jgi:hypothetical protein
MIRGRGYFLSRPGSHQVTLALVLLEKLEAVVFFQCSATRL